MVLPDTVASVRLADVLSSCVTAMGGGSNPLHLSPVSKAAVLVVDGLGAHNLEYRRGHARWLTGAWRTRGIVADSGFPSTTASALTSLTTGQNPGSHGLVGYTLRDPDSGALVNHLKDWGEGIRLDEWQRSPTLFETVAARGIPAVAMGEHRFVGSDFTQAVWRGAQFVGTGSLEEQFETLRAMWDEHDSGLAYLYWPALDRTGHSSGVESEAWTRRLEDLDQMLRALDSLVHDDEGFVITADHGMVDVPESNKMMVREDSALLHGVSAWGGEPRVPQLYVDSPSAQADLVAAWKETVGDTAVVMTRDQVIDEGYFGDVADEVRPRIGDILVVAVEDCAFYRTEVASVQSQKMVGQHGSITAQEREVPVIPLGAWR
mgnify:FL=1